MGTGTFTSVFALPEFASHFDDPHLVREKDRVLLFYAGLDPASIEVTCEGNLVRVKAKTHQKFEVWWWGLRDILLYKGYTSLRGI